MVNMVTNAFGNTATSPGNSNPSAQPLLLASTKVMLAVGVPHRPDLGKMELVFRDDPRVFYAKDSRGNQYELKAQTLDEAIQEIRNKLGGKGYTHATDWPLGSGSLTPKPRFDFSDRNPFDIKPAPSFVTPYTITDGMGAGSFNLPPQRALNLTAPRSLLSPLSPEMQAAIEQRLPGVVNGWFAKLHTALVQFDRGQIRRDQFGNVYAAVKANIAKIGWNDKLTEAQKQALRNAERAYSPTMRVKSHSAGVTEKGRDGRTYEFKAEVSTTEKLARDGNWYVTEAKITRIYFDNGTGNVGAKQDRVLKMPVDVSKSNGMDGKPVGTPLRSVDAVLTSARAKLRLQVAGMWNQDAPKDAKGRLIPPRVYTISDTTGAMIKGFGRVGIDFVTGFAQLALVPLAGLGELVNVLASPFTGDDVLIPAAHKYASEFRQGLLDLTKFVAEHGTEIPGLALKGFQQELKNIDRMMADGNLLGAIEKITYLTGSLVVAVADLKSLPKSAAGLVGKLKTSMATAENIVGQLRKLPTEKLNLLKGPNFRVGGKTGELLVPKAASNVPKPVPKPVSTPQGTPVALPLRPTLPPNLSGAKNAIKPTNRPFTSVGPANPAKPTNPDTGAAGVLAGKAGKPSSPPDSVPNGSQVSPARPTGSNQPQWAVSYTPMTSSLNVLEPKAPPSGAPSATLEPPVQPKKGSASPNPSEGGVPKQGAGNPASGGSSAGGDASTGTGGPKNPTPPTPSSAGGTNNDAEAIIKQLLEQQKQNPRFGAQLQMPNGELRFTQSPEMIRRWINNGASFTGRIGTRDMLPDVLPRPQTSAIPPNEQTPASPLEGARPSAAPNSESGGSASAPQVDRPLDASTGTPGTGGTNVPPPETSSASPAGDANDPSVIYEQLKQQRMQTGNPDLVAWFETPNGQLFSARGILPIEKLVDQQGARFVGISSRTTPPKTAIIDNSVITPTSNKPNSQRDEAIDQLNRLFKNHEGDSVFDELPENVRDKLVDGLAMDPDFIKNLDNSQQAEKLIADEATVIAAATQTLQPNSKAKARPYDAFELFDLSNARNSSERPDAIIVKQRLLEKGQQFVDIRDGEFHVPGRPEPFRFFEYKKGVQPTPILDPNNLAKLPNDYVVNGKKVAWYDAKEKLIMVDSEALFNLGMSTSTISAETRDPVLNALWKTIAKTGGSAITEPSTPQRNVVIVQNNSIGKNAYTAAPERQSTDIKEMMGVPPGEPLLSRKLEANGLIEYWNPNRSERQIMKDRGLDLPGREADAEKFIAARRSWARTVVYLNEHGGQSRTEIAELLARDGIPTLGGDMNVSRKLTIENMTGSGFMPDNKSGIWRGLKYVNVENMTPEIFRKGKYASTELAGRLDAVKPLMDRAVQMQVQKKWVIDKVVTGFGLVTLSGTASGLILNYCSSQDQQNLQKHLNAAPEALYYGLPVNLSSGELIDLQTQIKQAAIENGSSEKLGAVLFSSRADGSLRLKGTMDLKSDYDIAIRQYGELQRQVTELSNIVVASGRIDGPEADEMNKVAVRAAAKLDQAETILNANELLLKLWAKGIMVQGEKVLGLDQAKLPSYFSNYLTAIETSRKQITSFRLALAEGKAVASNNALNLGNAVTNQKIAEKGQDITVEADKLKTGQAEAGLLETEENNRRTTSQFEFNKWKTTEVDKHNESALNAYGNSEVLAPRVTFAGVSIVVAPPLVNDVKQSPQQRLAVTMAIVNSIPQGAELVVVVPGGPTLDQQKAVAEKAIRQELEAKPDDPGSPQTNDPKMTMPYFE
jgi:hypothetical protein